MPTLTLVTGADKPILRTICKHVEIFDEALYDTVEDMVETMMGDQAGGVRGIGLAANQVGIDARIMIVTFNLDKKEKNHRPVAMINPEILETSESTCVMEEGCLSLPEKFGKVRRPAKLKIRWQNVDGNWAEKKISGWDARVFLHELDHLDGKLFIDYL
jgi:peptide deformylase